MMETGGSLAGRVALITGASGGIGWSIAAAFAREGAAVAAAYLPGTRVPPLPEGADAGRWLAVPCDVIDRSSAVAALALTTDRLGAVDVLVNNAAIVTRAPFLELADDDWQQTLDVNLTGSFRCAQLVARQMASRGAGGRIINISSISASVPAASRVHYCVSKSGVGMLTRAMALELAPFGISVNAIAPGTIETDLNRDVLSVPERREAARARIPAGRFGMPVDIAGTALLLASDAGDYITGQTIVVDGGMSLGTP